MQAGLGFIRVRRAGPRAQRQEEEMRKQEWEMDETWKLEEYRLERDDEVEEEDNEREGVERGW